MLRKMYYDTFANEYTKSKDSYAPPERYIRTVRGDTDNLFIEHMRTSKHGETVFFDLMFTEEEYKDLNLRYKKTDRVIKENGYSGAQCVKFTLPPTLFDEYAERFGLV